MSFSRRFGGPDANWRERDEEMEPKSVNGNIAAIAAIIGFAASVLVLLVKESFDRRRQRRAAMNSLRLMISSLWHGIEVHPEHIPHAHLDKMMSMLHDLATQEDLLGAFRAYDEALRRYRTAWQNNSSPTAAEREGIESLLSAADARLAKYKDGLFGRLVDAIAR